MRLTIVVFCILAFGCKDDSNSTPGGAITFEKAGVLKSGAFTDLDFSPGGRAAIIRNMTGQGRDYVVYFPAGDATVKSEELRGGGKWTDDDMIRVAQEESGDALAAIDLPAKRAMAKGTPWHFEVHTGRGNKGLRRLEGKDMCSIQPGHIDLGWSPVVLVYNDKRIQITGHEDGEVAVLGADTAKGRALVSCIGQPTYLIDLASGNRTKLPHARDVVGKPWTRTAARYLLVPGEDVLFVQLLQTDFIGEAYYGTSFHIANISGDIVADIDIDPALCKYWESISVYCSNEMLIISVPNQLLIYRKVSLS